jgi:hypothetical protein
VNRDVRIAISISTSSHSVQHHHTVIYLMQARENHRIHRIRNCIITHACSDALSFRSHPPRRRNRRVS